MSTNIQEILRQIGARIAAEPLSAAIQFGVLFAGVYLLLMLTTRLGDVRRGLQSFILSASIHILILLALGEVVPRTERSASPSEELIEIPIREVILEERTSESNSESGESPLLETLPESDRPDFARREVSNPTGLTMPEVRREAVDVEAANVPLPEPEPPSAEGTTPSTSRIESKIGASKPEESGLKLEEETAKRNPVESQTRIQRESESSRGIQEIETDRKSTSETKPLPPVTAPDNPDPVQEEVAAQRGDDSKKGLSKEAVEQKGDLAVEDPGPGGDSNEKSIPDSPFVRKSLEGGQAPNASARMKRNSGGAGVQEAIDGKSVTESQKRKNPAGESSERIPAASGDPSSSIPAEIPQTYRLRDVNRRRERAISLGATRESEEAVELGLAWLSKHQHPKGYWDADGFTSNCPAGDHCEGEGGDHRPSAVEGGARSNAFDPEALRKAGKHADTGLTGLVILCYLGAGYTHEEGKYAEQVDRALHWLVEQQEENGFLGGSALRYDKMYCHGMATLALGEACGMTRDPSKSRSLRRALARGVDYIIAVQNPRDGGWRYLPGQRGDMSMFGWQLMALRSGEVAGIPIPAETREKMFTFLGRTEGGRSGGLSGYMPGEAPKRSMTAESLFCRMIVGLEDASATEEGISYLMEELPRESRPDLYYWYYGTLALYHHGGAAWEKWNGALRETLVGSQRKTGHASGSWDPRDPWSVYGGRIYSTTFSVLSLEVYYRFLPLYQAGGGKDKESSRERR